MTDSRVYASCSNILENLSSNEPRSPSNRRLDSGVLAKLVSNAIVHALEALIAAILSPVLIWRWLAKHEHFVLILRVTLEVLLELSVLVIFAGVSIFITAILVLEHKYYGGSTEEAENASEQEKIKDFKTIASNEPNDRQTLVVSVKSTKR
ncbi:hypothetical protein TKK_0004512 [Trichogramma kaykai]